ncbi:MAG: SGNH/GDSL hydrolase family protein [Bacteroidetes bacterium]|nr:SGNH/GDSL hydrolase family protein [Bacteroidota bacterium]
MKGKNGLIYSLIFIGLVSSWILPVWGCAKNQAKGATTSLPADTVRATPPSTDTGMLRWLALGDSYTIGQSVAVQDRYPVQTAALLEKSGVHFQNPEIIATTGWTTGNLLDALRGKSAPPAYSIVTLLIGVNNQYQGRSIDEFRTQFNALLIQSIQLSGGKPGRVIALSIPDYSVTPFAAGRDPQTISRELDSFNEAARALAGQYKVQWLDVTTASRMAAMDRTLIAADSLHFSGREYAIWAGLLAPLIRQSLQ